MSDVSIGGYHFSCELIHFAGIGAFNLRAQNDEVLRSFIGGNKLSSTWWTIDAETNERTLILDLGNTEHYLQVFQASIRMVQEQSSRYNSQDFRRFIISRLRGNDKDEGLINRACELMKHEIDIKIPSICEALYGHLDNGLDEFPSHYYKLLSAQGEEYKKIFEKTVPSSYLRDGLITNFKVVEEAFGEHISHDNGLFNCQWLIPILEAWWEEDLKPRAIKMDALPLHTPNIILDLASARIPEVTTGNAFDRYEYTPNVWLDSQALGGLPPATVDRILTQHNKAYVIDILKLLTSLWGERADIQRAGRFNMPRRYAGLAEMLNERYQISMGGDTQSNLVAACHFLNALRFAQSESSYENLVSVGGLESRGQLIFTYLEGFLNPIKKGERLVPILDHPQGSTRSRALYNRLGLSIGCFLVDNSDTYFRSGGAGVPLDAKAVGYLQQRSGYSKRSGLNKALSVFEAEGAIEISNDLMKLGEKNVAGEELIFQGIKKSIRGRKGGLKSSRAKSKKGR